MFSKSFKAYGEVSDFLCKFSSRSINFGVYNYNIEVLENCVKLAPALKLNLQYNSGLSKILCLFNEESNGFTEITIKFEMLKSIKYILAVFLIVSLLLEVGIIFSLKGEIPVNMFVVLLPIIIGILGLLLVVFLYYSHSYHMYKKIKSYLEAAD